MAANVQVTAGVTVRPRTRLVLLALPVVILAAVGISWLVMGPGWDLLLPMAVGPAVAAGVGALLYTLAVGAAALGESLAFTVSLPPPGQRPAQIMFLAVAGVTAAGVLTGLYEVVTTPGSVRLIVGDVEGKGLAAVASAAAVLGVFREAAHDEGSLTAIAARIEVSLARELDDEHFVTAVLAEISPDGDKVELLSCGHPAPLLVRDGQARLLGLGQASLPLGLGQLADVPRIPLVSSFQPGDQMLFYTDGVSEARNKAGEFFPLADSASVHTAADPATLVDRLGDEVIRHVGHAPDDDVALLLAYRDAA